MTYTAIDGMHRVMAATNRKKALPSFVAVVSTCADLPTYCLVFLAVHLPNLQARDARIPGTGDGVWYVVGVGLGLGLGLGSGSV
jgi:hypothetical protein